MHILTVPTSALVICTSYVLGIYLMSAGLIVKFFSVFFLVMTYIVYKPPAEPKPDQVLGPRLDTDESIVSIHLYMR